MVSNPQSRTNVSTEFWLVFIVHTARVIYMTQYIPDLMPDAAQSLQLFRFKENTEFFADEIYVIT